MTAPSVLLTGATGLIGRQLVRALGSSKVFALTRRTPDGGPNATNVTWIEHDLAAPALPRDLPPRVDAVVHLAQSEAFRDFPEKAADIFDVNVASTFRLLEWARTHGARRFVHASTGGVYGDGERPFVETDPPSESLGFYASSKRAAELLALAYAGSFVVVVVRPFFVYGAGQRTSMLIPRLVRSVAEGRPIVLHGAPDGPRFNPVHVSDAVAALRRCLDLDATQTINIAGPEVLTLREIGIAIGRALGREPLFEVAASGPPHHLVGSTKKMTALLAAPSIRLVEGVRELRG